MPLKITWQSVDSAEQQRVSVPILDTALVLTLAEDVIIDASWLLHDPILGNHESAFALQVQQYLTNPNVTDLQLKLKQQGSTYCNKVWNALLQIPVGQVVSYSELAEKLNSGPRAIAQACRANPYAGLIPCHRVVAKASIGGFMGHGNGEFVELKQRLLAYERSIGRASQ